MCLCSCTVHYRPVSWGVRSDWNHTCAAYCYNTNTSFNNPACNCFGEPMPDAMRTTRPTIRILVSSWPAAAIDAFLLKIIVEERFGSAEPRPNFPDLPDPRAHTRGLTGRICSRTRRFPRHDFAGRSAPALHRLYSRVCNAPGLQISRSVDRGLGRFNVQF